MLANYFDVTESIESLSTNSLIKYVEVKKLTKSTNTFSRERYKRQFGKKSNDGNRCYDMLAICLCCWKIP